MRLAQNGFTGKLGQPRPLVGFYDPLLAPAFGSYLVVYIDDAETGNPVPGAVVTTAIPAYGLTRTVQAPFEGMVELRFIAPPAPVTVTVTAPGYAPATVVAETSKSPLHGVTVKLAKRGATVPLLAVGVLAALGLLVFG